MHQLLVKVNKWHEYGVKPIIGSDSLMYFVSAVMSKPLHVKIDLRPY